MKRLIVCFDGTWNTPDDRANATNVVNTMRAIRSSDDEGVEQITFYDKGVGTGGPLDRIRGGAFGRGLGDNVQDGYRFLANNYEPGRRNRAADEIYIFGFSRGAFTARSLAGFIGACGLLDKNSMGELKRAWRYYRTDPRKRQPKAEAFPGAGRRLEVPINCVGVWDTVGALGVPIEAMRWMNRGAFKFHDTTLGLSIACALHAVAIDEQRGPFAPTLWQSPKASEKQIVEQVWFAGVHSNIGGSYDDPGLSDLALDWMIKRVVKFTDLAFDHSQMKRRVRGDHLATLYESRSAAYLVSWLFPLQRVIGGAGGWIRRLWPRTNRPDKGEHFVNEMIHHSAIARFGTSARHQSGDRGGERIYAPENLRAALRGKVAIVDGSGEPLPDAKADRLREAALGRAAD